MEIPVTAIADSIKRGDILLSEFDGIDHRKQKRTTSVVGRMKDEHINDVVEMVKASKVISERHKNMFFK